MNVLHINTKAASGGAARAMKRLHDQLIALGHQSKIAAGRVNHPDSPDLYRMDQVTDDYWTPARRWMDRIGKPMARYFGLNSWTNRSTLDFHETDLYRWADILDFRNLFGGYFNLWALPELTRKKPAVWRLPDFWALTGACAYPFDCSRWIHGCHHCPLLRGKGRELYEPKPAPVFDLTGRIWKKKRELYADSHLHIVVNSEWMKTNLQKSILKDSQSLTVISNGVDLDVFKPVSKVKARRRLNLPEDKFILLWAGASLGIVRKGYPLAASAVKDVQSAYPQVYFTTMGNRKRMDEKYPLPRTRHFDYVRDPEQQALIYSAADVFLCTTLADAQPQTVLEASACGTPTVAFDIGPLPEIVTDSETGFLARVPSAIALVEQLEKAIDSPDLLEAMSRNCRSLAEIDFSAEKQAREFIDLFENILNQ